MRHEIVECDRCGKSEPASEARHWWVTANYEDLCPECIRKDDPDLARALGLLPREGVRS